MLIPLIVFGIIASIAIGQKKSISDNNDISGISKADKIERLIRKMEAQKGIKYHLGAGQDVGYPYPEYTDCGLTTKKALESIGVTVQRTVTEQVAQAPYVIDVTGRTLTDIKSLLKPGDFVGFDWLAGGRYSHTGIWTGNKIIHASSTANKVTEVDISYFSAKGFRSIYSWTR